MVGSEDIFRKYRQYVVTSHVKQIEPIFITGGKGTLVRDVDGKEYLDCFSGISVANTGHCHEKARATAKIREMLRAKGILIGVGGVKANVVRIQPHS